ncbi:MAG: hypothetical protein ACOY4I_18045 [Bacillota bacterium]
MSGGPNPYVLFLILILLIAGMDPQAGEKVDTIKRIMDRVTAGVNNVKTSINTLSADFEDIHLMLRGMGGPAASGRK